MSHMNEVRESLGSGSNGEITNNIVLESNAGFYLGTLFWDDMDGQEFGDWHPYKRNTEYMTKDMAEKMLAYWKQSNDE